MRNRLVTHVSILAVLLVTLACNLAALDTQASPPQQPASVAPAHTPSQPEVVPAVAGSATLPPFAATVLAATHVATPANVDASGKLNYDVESSGTGPEHRAPYGDSYNINLFERPFTQLDMTYLPQLDISTFQLSEDPTWHYVSIDFIGGDMNDPTGINYGVELDVDHDGFGDYLVWAGPPYTSQWLAETVQVLQDTNHDTGGASAEKSDAVFPGNGYDKIIFDRGQGQDPDLAFVRLNPGVSAAIQFAFKRSLAGNAFMWGVWADSGLRAPGQFNYNDRFTEEQAGSPEKSEKQYPIKAIYQVDNTCWVPVGFKPTGYEPHLCPSPEPRPTKQKPQPTPSDPQVPGCTGLICNPEILQYLGPAIPLEPVICLPGNTMIDTPDGPVAVEDLTVGAAVWTATKTGERIAGTVLKLSEVPVPPLHELVHVVLSDGRSVSASPGHPTTDGRTFGQLVQGTSLDGATVTRLELLASNDLFTYDLLPSGSTGQYWADDVLIGSTLK